MITSIKVFFTALLLVYFFTSDYGLFLFDVTGRYLGGRWWTRVTGPFSQGDQVTVILVETNQIT